MRVRVLLADIGGGPRPSCGMIGCNDLVLFWCETSQEWVCYPHGFLVLRREWGCAGEGPIEGELAAPQTKHQRKEPHGLHADDPPPTG